MDFAWIQINAPLAGLIAPIIMLPSVQYHVLTTALHMELATITLASALVTQIIIKVTVVFCAIVIYVDHMQHATHRVLALVIQATTVSIALFIVIQL